MKRHLFISLICFILIGAFFATACTGAQPQEPTAVPTEIETEETQEQEEVEPTKQPVEEPTKVPVEEPTKEAVKEPIEITIVVGAEPRSLHPSAVTDAASEAILLNSYESLVFLSREGEIEPLLAESWEIIDDTTFHFKLREGVKFHDGTPLTVEGVVSAFNEIITPADEQPYGSSIFTTNIQEVSAVDEDTLMIKTEVPFGPLFRNLTQIRIHPSGMSREEISSEVNGTGPYKLTEYVEGSHMIMERYEDYWGPQPQIDRVTFRIVPEASARVAEMQTLQADIVANIPPELVRVIAGVPNVKLIVSPTTYRITMTYNLEKDSPIKDPKVRQAINYAANSGSIIDNILGGYGEQVGPLLEQDLGYDPNFVDYEFDPDKARALLEEAGYPDGFEVVIATPQGRYAKDKEVSEAFAGMLREVGIDAQIQIYEWGALLDQLVGGTIDPIYLIGWRGVNFDASAALTGWNCESPYSNYCIEEVQEYLVEGQSKVLTEEREAAYREALEIYLSDPSAAYLFQETAIFGAADNIDWTPRVDQLILVKTITKQ